MIRRWRGTLVVVTLAFASSGLAFARGSIEEVPLSQVPDQVKRAASKAVPGVCLTRAMSHFCIAQDYFLDGKDIKGREVMIAIAEEGIVWRINTTVPMNEVPDDVLNAFRAASWNRKWSVSRIVREAWFDDPERYVFHGPNPQSNGEKAEFIAIEARRPAK
jgi:hypothetical protein